MGTMGIQSIINGQGETELDNDQNQEKISRKGGYKHKSGGEMKEARRRGADQLDDQTGWCGWRGQPRTGERGGILFCRG